MKKRRSKRSHRNSRPWVIPPGLLMMDEPFEGFLVLDEVHSELGVLLWQCLRDVDLWAGTPAEVRRDLFNPNAIEQRLERIAEETDPESSVRTMLDLMARVLDGPGAPRPAELSEACESLSRWASDQGWPRTALAFAQRSALAAPELAGPAYLVGMVARRGADYRRAETWFRRALALARRNRDWKYYGLAHLGLANLHMQRGDAPSARARLLRALRAARRYGVWSVRPFALHDLFCIAANGGDRDQAEMYARAAFRSYGRRHPRLPALAHDVAWFWMLQRHYGRALEMFRAVLRHVPRPPERMVVLANIARSAAGLGDAEGYESAWKEVWRIVENRADTERVAEAMISLAHGAYSLREGTRMEMSASLALRVATRRHEAQERLAAEDLLNRARNLKARRRRGAPMPPVAPPVEPEPGAEPSSADQLHDDLVEALLEVPLP